MARLSDLLFGQRFEETYEIGKHKFAMQSLWKSEEVEVTDRSGGRDIYEKFDKLKVPTLARAIVSIDGVALSAQGEVQDEIKRAKDAGKELDTITACEIALSHQDGGFIELLYTHYLKLKDAREKERESLVNFTQAPNNGASTDSVSSSTVDQKN